MKQNLVFQESTQWMEAKCAKMPPMGSKLTEALKTQQNSLSKFAYQAKFGEIKNSVIFSS